MYEVERLYELDKNRNYYRIPQYTYTFMSEEEMETPKTNKPQAIRVMSQIEMDEAIRYFQRQGYILSELFTTNDYDIKVRTQYSGKVYIVISQKGKINWSGGYYAEAYCEIISLPKLKPLAIGVANKDESDAAIKYFKSLGYKESDCIKKYPYMMGYDRYTCIGYNGTIEHSTGVYAEANCDIISLPKSEVKTENKMSFKVGDIVRITDGSWCLGIKDGVFIRPNGTELSSATWKILSIGGYKWPINGPGPCSMKDFTNNDTVLVNVNNPAHILITNSALLKDGNQITIQGKEVVVKSDGSLQIGCTLVDTETVQKIIKKIGRVN